MLRKCKLALVCQNKSNLYEIFQLKNEILTFASASLSVIISAASYLMEKFS